MQPAPPRIGHRLQLAPPKTETDEKRLAIDLVLRSQTKTIILDSCTLFFTAASWGGRQAASLRSSGTCVVFGCKTYKFQLMSARVRLFFITTRVGSKLDWLHRMGPMPVFKRMYTHVTYILVPKAANIATMLTHTWHVQAWPYVLNNTHNTHC